MFKKLKYQIVAINMTVITLMLVVVFSLGNIWANENTQRMYTEMLRSKQTALEETIMDGNCQTLLYEVAESSEDEILVNFTIYLSEPYLGTDIQGRMYIKPWRSESFLNGWNVGSGLGAIDAEGNFIFDMSTDDLRLNDMGIMTYNLGPDETADTMRAVVGIHDELIFAFASAGLQEMADQVAPSTGPGVIAHGYVFFDEGELATYGGEATLNTYRHPELYGPQGLGWVRNPDNYIHYDWCVDYFTGALTSFVVYPKDAYQTALDDFLSTTPSQFIRTTPVTIESNGQKWLYTALVTSVSGEAIEWDTEKTFAQIDADINLILLDITNTAKQLDSSRFSLIVVGMVLLGVFLLVSFLISKQVVQPVEESWKRQTQFISDTSHELKTPLAIISANQEVLQNNLDETVVNHAKWLDSIKSETVRMSKLVTALLALSQGDEAPAKLETVDLSAFVEEAATEYEVLAFEQEIDMTRTVEPDLVVSFDEEDLRSALSALLDNAIRYTPPKHQVSIALVRERKHAVLTIMNNGVEIKAEDLPHLFDRFYRGDKARVRSNEYDEDSSTESVSRLHSGGFGLGLAIAKSAIERTGGTIEASSSNDTFTITVKLPLDKTALQSETPITTLEAPEPQATDTTALARFSANRLVISGIVVMLALLICYAFSFSANSLLGSVRTESAYSIQAVMCLLPTGAYAFMGISALLFGSKLQRAGVPRRWTTLIGSGAFVTALSWLLKGVFNSFFVLLIDQTSAIPIEKVLLTYS